MTTESPVLCRFILRGPGGSIFRKKQQRSVDPLAAGLQDRPLAAVAVAVAVAHRQRSCRQTECPWSIFWKGEPDFL